MLRRAKLGSNDGGTGLRPLEKAALPFDSRARTVARVAIAILVVLLAAWVARDFLVALTWAAVIAIAVWPINIRFAISAPGGRSPAVAPLLFTFLTGLVLLVPIALAVHQIAQGSDAFARSLNQLQQSGIPVPAWLARLPIAGEYLDPWWRTNLGNPEVLVDWLRGVNTESITAWTSTLGGARCCTGWFFSRLRWSRYSWCFAMAPGWRTAHWPLPVTCSGIPASAWSERSRTPSVPL
jgi:hypothetical protein